MSCRKVVKSFAPYPFANPHPMERDFLPSIPTSRDAPLLLLIMNLTGSEYVCKQGDPTSSSERKSVLNIHWKD